MRVTSDVLGGLLRPVAAKPKPRQPTSRERAQANRLRVLPAVAEHGHLRCADLATCWLDAKYGEQMAQRTAPCASWWRPASCPPGDIAMKA